ncbi:MAG: acetate--CoA ligase family protein [Kiloniellales bacterium]
MSLAAAQIEARESPLHAILNPRALAVIGASNDPTKRGYQAVKQLQADGFARPIYPINPKAPEILGLTAYPSLEAVPGPIDLALVCTPARTLPKLLVDCGAKGIKGAVILAAGFGEAGEAGKALEAEVLAVAQAQGIRLIGPNTNGVFNLHHRMNLVGVKDAEPGNIGIVSQSGNMMLALITEAQRRRQLGFSTYIGVGNQLDVRFNEYLEYFGEDEKTDVPVLYVEGFKNGRRFLEVAREVTQKKPVVVYKSGRTEAGQVSASSHTGSLAGSFALTRDLLRQAGVTLVEQSDKILSVAEGLSLLPPAEGPRVAVLADSGGHGTITTDALVEAGLSLADLSEESRVALAAVLPAQASLKNPVDVAGGTDDNPAVFADCAGILLQDENVDLLMIVGMFGGYAVRFAESLSQAEIETSAKIGALAKAVGKPVIVQSLYATHKPEPLTVLRAAGIPLFIWPENAIRCAAECVRYGAARRRLAANPPRPPAAPRAAVTAVVEKARSEGRSALFEEEAKQLLAHFGVAVPESLLLRSEADVALAAARFGSRALAMKIVSQDILHKSDAGGVKLKVSGAAAIADARREILANAKAYDPAAQIEGVLATPMAEPGVEVILGVVQDPIFGPVMMFGLGGIFVEVLKDVAFRALPMSRADAAEMLDQIASRKILEGVRGRGPVDRQALLDLMMAVAALAEAHPEIAEIDLNPVIVREEGLDLADARMILAEAT